eukprot:2936262-Amphidinium_carterae.1
MLLADVAQKRPDFAGLETGLSTQTYRHLKKCPNKRDDRTRSAVNTALGGVWHEVRTHSAFTVGDLCVQCREEPEDLGHILFRSSGTRIEDRRSSRRMTRLLRLLKLHGLLPVSYTHLRAHETEADL